MYGRVVHGRDCARARSSRSVRGSSGGGRGKASGSARSGLSDREEEIFVDGWEKQLCVVKAWVTVKRTTKKGISLKVSIVSK